MKKKQRQWGRKKAKRNKEERKETQLVSDEMKADSISVWVMNTVHVAAKVNTLGAIYERGLIGTYMKWYVISSIF